MLLLKPFDEFMHGMIFFMVSASLAIPGQRCPFVGDNGRMLAKVEKVIGNEDPGVTSILKDVTGGGVVEGMFILYPNAILTEVDIVATTLLPTTGMRLLLCKLGVPVVGVEVHRRFGNPHCIDYFPFSCDSRGVTKQPISYLQA
jgi:hypothetical protein